ncbi:ABC transporter substrate-binding protein [Catenulispora rubra]|uniref:ABC transporter substrate-binding protein n=1 Tax=Catenulispora rubra TaxID=280293 RepID=UPI00189275C2|nr:ABC transporter substrate-binding protein [Catenulispora rubra]
MKRLLIGVLALGLSATACSGRSAAPSTGTSTTSTGGAASSASAGAFGTLQNVCHSGTPTASTAQGVTATTINVGTLSDVGFSKNPELGDAAKVFTSWCNDAGGINGRKIVDTVRDSALMQVPQRILEACPKDFALVGGSAAFDGTGTADRLKCLLPDYSAQTDMVQATGSDLQVVAYGAGVGYSQYSNYFSWLTKEAYPDSAANVGIIAGDVPITKVDVAQDTESLTALGSHVGYSDLYPAAGVSDWTPYAEAIKSKGVKGLVFLGDFRSLAVLEKALDDIGYKLDWIDANSNAYTPQFIQLAGTQVLGTQNNYADLGGVFPLEEAASNPATKQLVDLFAKYAPGEPVTYPVVRAFSAWLLFATAAGACSDLTRPCVFQNAMKQTAWTGGGLQAPADLSSVTAQPKCFNVVQAKPAGWVAADFKPTEGAYRCDTPALKFTGDYGKPLTLADVGKSMADFK